MTMIAAMTTTRATVMATDTAMATGMAMDTATTDLQAC
jgi:hypothetical protein